MIKIGGGALSELAYQEVDCFTRDRAGELCRAGTELSSEFLATLPDVFALDDLEEAMIKWRRDHRTEPDMGKSKMCARLPERP